MSRQKVKKAIERITGYRIMDVGRRTFVLGNRKIAGRVWFSYELQLRSILEQCKVDLVLDVGANRGQFGRMLRKAYAGRLMSFEPLPDVFGDLQRVASGDPHWDVYNVALGSREGMQSFHVSEKSEFSSFLETNEYCGQRFGAQAQGTREELVAMRRLDQLLREVLPDLDRARIYLKLDTQGYDMEVFNGLGEVRDRVVALQTEVSLMPIYKGMPHWTDSIRFLEEAGFGVTGLFPVSREELRVIEYDCTMVRVGAVESCG